MSFLTLITFYVFLFSTLHVHSSFCSSVLQLPFSFGLFLSSVLSSPLYQTSLHLLFLAPLFWVSCVFLSLNFSPPLVSFKQILLYFLLLPLPSHPHLISSTPLLSFPFLILFVFFLWSHIINHSYSYHFPISSSHSHVRLFFPPLSSMSVLSHLCSLLLYKSRLFCFIIFTQTPSFDLYFFPQFSNTFLAPYLCSLPLLFINFHPRSFIYLSLSSSSCVPPPHRQTIHILSSVSACSISVCVWMPKMNGLASGVLYYAGTCRPLLPVCPILSYRCTHTNISSHDAGLNQCQQCGEETKWTNNRQCHIRRDWCWDGGGQKVIKKREESL